MVGPIRQSSSSLRYHPYRRKTPLSGQENHHVRVPRSRGDTEDVDMVDVPHERTIVTTITVMSWMSPFINAVFVVGSHCTVRFSIHRATTLPGISATESSPEGRVSPHWILECRESLAQYALSAHYHHQALNEGLRQGGLQFKELKISVQISSWSYYVIVDISDSKVWFVVKTADMNDIATRAQLKSPIVAIWLGEHWKRLIPTITDMTAAFAVGREVKTQRIIPIERE
ncbi:hypothetical protein DFH05DRAFT_1455186 [Lentinula detonsa]|uniref:Uncharacterized protein n=1 Tax=Lentinula detonsa TaxID=2804962 RepID=A0A9W8U2A6_9AGAR|nr:hypothetical protein DFH05DRAFT_1455186 [Lentinula detonsa]